MEKLAFTTVTFRDKTRKEICEIAKKNNIKYLEWGSDVHLPFDDEKALNEVLNLQKEYDLKAISYGTYYRLGSNDIESFKKIVDTANKIGAKIIRIWAGDKSSDKTDENELKKYANETKLLCDIAKEKDLTVAFEFHHNTFNDSGKSSNKLLNAVLLDNLKTYWQPFSTKEDIENLNATLKNLVCVHVFNWNKNGVRFSLSLGKRKWKKYLDVIKSNNLEPFYIFEFVKKDSEKQFEKDVKAFRKILSK